MTDLIHFAMLLIGLCLIGIGLWMVAPAAMLIGVGGILLAIVWMARTVKEPRNARDTFEGK